MKGEYKDIYGKKRREEEVERGGSDEEDTLYNEGTGGRDDIDDIFLPKLAQAGREVLS